MLTVIEVVVVLVLLVLPLLRPKKRKLKYGDRLDISKLVVGPDGDIRNGNDRDIQLYP